MPRSRASCHTARERLVHACSKSSLRDTTCKNSAARNKGGNTGATRRAKPREHAEKKAESRVGAPSELMPISSVLLTHTDQWSAETAPHSEQYFWMPFPTVSCTWLWYYEQSPRGGF